MLSKTMLPLFLATIPLMLQTPSVFAQTAPTALSLAPRSMPRSGEVDERFQSYNIEALEVTGGRFWKPYAQADATSASPKQNTGGTGVGLSADLFAHRDPIDLSNSRLRTLARALGPAYVRVSGTWRNTTFFQDDDLPALTTPPPGFSGVLTRAEWKGVVDFARATDAKIITSFATSAGTRDENGVWTSDQAAALLAYTRSVGGDLAATEFMNEPTLAARGGGVPEGYSPSDYARDAGLFRAWLRQASPSTLFLGPGGEGEGMNWKPSAMIQRVPSEELLRASGPIYDAYSFHFYSAISSRCSALIDGGVTLADTLTHHWFLLPNQVFGFYSDIARRYMPGKPIWVTETGEAACGGDRWASTFLDTFRYLNELGSMAKNGVQVVAHNTLAASDYALLDETTFAPRPDYWSALLWHRLMGSTVLNWGVTTDKNLQVYAHCLEGHPGGVSVLLINPSAAPVPIALGMPADVYTLTAPELQSKSVMLNNRPLALDNADRLPSLDGARVAQNVRLPAYSSSFVVFPAAANPACRKH